MEAAPELARLPLADLGFPASALARRGPAGFPPALRALAGFPPAPRGPAGVPPALRVLALAPVSLVPLALTGRRSGNSGMTNAPFERMPKCITPEMHNALNAQRLKCIEGHPRTGDPQWNDVRRRPTLPRGGPRSTIGAERLSFRVRNGTGRFPLAMTAVTLLRCQSNYRPYPGNCTVDA